MMYLKLNSDGTIASILADMPSGDYVHVEVPVGYPETVDWDAADQEFKPSTEKGLKCLRLERDRLLEATDKYMVPDRPMSTEQRDLWVDYRQALRDLPENTLDPFSPEWPIAPE